MSNYLDDIAWNSDGLAPVITLESGSGELLMQAWVNREALQTTIEEGRAVYWSRSRNQLWRKGEESGNTQKLVDVFLDCDDDSLCYVVEQIGGVACHTGRKSCFHKKLQSGQWIAEGEVLIAPEQMYNRQAGGDSE